MADPQQSLTHFFQTRFLLWAIRWVIGFGLIWLLVAYYPEYSWLWWVGGVVAALSLAVTAFAYFVLNRKLRQLTEKMLEAGQMEDDAEVTDGADGRADPGGPFH